MRAFVRITAAALFGLAATACNVTPQDLPPSTSGGNPGGANGGSTGVTRGGNGSSTGGSGSSTGGNGTSTGASTGSSTTGGSTGAASSSGTGTASSSSGSAGSGTSSGSSTSSGGSSGGTTGDAGVLVVGGIQFVTVDYPDPADPFMGVDYQTNYTINPVAQFVFQVQDPTGKVGVPDVPVTFSINTPTQNLGASLVGTTQCSTSAPCTSNAQGQVSIGLQSGHQAGAVTVTASVTLPNGQPANATGVSNIVGTQPNVTNSSIICGPVNLPAYVANNTPCNTSTSEKLSTTCTVSLNDRFNNAIGVPVSVHFYTEAGNWQQAVVSSPSYGATGQQSSPGVATNVLETTGNLPEDVTPLPPGPGNPNGEPSYSGTCSIVSREFNPRDGLVTVIAVFNGEEPFTDVGGTGSWVPGDPWVDMPQPFVDSNDNSAWDPGELCVGGAGPSGCALPNHQWDGNNAVWVEARLLFTGDPITSQTVWNPSSFTVGKGAPFQGSVLWPDVNLNVPAGAPNLFTSYGVAVFGSSCTSAPTVTYLPPGNNPPGGGPGDELGMTITRFGLPNSGNPECDAGYYFDDAGAQQPNPYCTFLTAITGFSGGFAGNYEVSESSACNSCTPVAPATTCTPPSGTVTVEGTAQSSLDTAQDRTQITGTAL